MTMLSIEKARNRLPSWTPAMAKAALPLIEEGWRGVAAFQGDYGDNNACCAVGALNRGLGGDPDDHRLAKGFLRAFPDDPDLGTGGPIEDLAHLNDDGGRLAGTKKRVLGTLRSLAQAASDD